MLRNLAALGAACWMVGSALAPAAVAQRWNDPRTTALVERAVALRERQLADTGLVDYTATAHGYVTFLAQVGQGFPEPPKVVKADELELQVYWHAPNQSKQVIVGRRDTLLLPTDIEYHRDHLGIVQNNFPDIIRIGEGDEVRDVPHPLSRVGLTVYDFAIADSLQIRIPGRTIDVYEVKVRPKNDRAPALVGALYVDRAEAQVVRMAFAFTRAAYLDPELEDISIVLENGLIDGRFWLPLHQEIEIRRTGTWLDYPARGIIRGRWEICCYRINTGIEETIFRGPEIVQAPPQALRRYPWTGAVLDSLPPDVRAATEQDVQRVQQDTRSLVRAQALARTQSAALAARGISDFARVNRVEGLAVGAGARHTIGPEGSAALRGRWGFADHQATGELTLEWRRPGGAGVSLFAGRIYREAGDVPEVSLARNSIAAQEFGSDYTDPYDVRTAGAALDLGRHLGATWRIEGSYERQDSLSVHATPASGHYESTIPAWSLREPRLVLTLDHPMSLSVLGTELRFGAELRAARYTARGGGAPWEHLERAALHADIERPVATQRLVLRATAAAVTASTALVPPQDLVYLGGPTSGPGYDFHEFAGKMGASAHVEWQTPIPFVPISLARFGRAPASATLAPFVHGIYVDHPDPLHPRGGFYPSAGVGLLALFDLVRLDAARGLRDGRWTFSADVSRDLWAIL